MRNNIPLELRALRQWVCAGVNKVPVSPRTGRAASVTDPSTWGTFDEACSTGSPFVGFVLTASDPYTIIDLDDKEAHPATPEQLEIHRRILDAIPSYTERSASGRGYHVVVRGTLPYALHRDTVEAYSTGRYMICTGNVVRSAPIVDAQTVLDILTREMTPSQQVELDDVGDTLTDEDVFELAINASNGDKFNALCIGDWKTMGYPSQSEADFALLSIFTFYTRSNEQVRRLFRMSALGRREKATADNRYLDRALRKIRARQPQDVDISGLLEKPQPQGGAAGEPGGGAPARVLAPHSEVSFVPPLAELSLVNSAKLVDLTLPPGLVGELAAYIYSSSIRPVPEVALCAAIALMSGAAARCYNVSGSGLNQYLVLLAKTGAGKDGAAAGIDRLMSAVRRHVPMADTFIGPGVFASGQALVKVLDERQCFVSILGEFGYTLRQLCDPDANSALVMLKRVLLDLYSKSGWTSLLRSSVYSDKEKNTKIVQAPNVTILGESTPDAFFEGLNAGHIAEGLIPRFSVVEYTGPRPPRNPNGGAPPSEELTRRLAELVATTLTMGQNNQCASVPLEARAQSLLDALDGRCDRAINDAKSDVDAQLWNRAHLKALKLAALIAVGVEPHNPVVTAPIAAWAISFIEREVNGVLARFQTGDVGSGSAHHDLDVQRALEDFAAMTNVQRRTYDVPKVLMNQAKLVPYTYLRRRLRALNSFTNDRRGAIPAIRAAIQDAVDSGQLVKLSPLQVREMGLTGELYARGKSE